MSLHLKFVHAFFELCLNSEVLYLVLEISVIALKMHLPDANAWLGNGKCIKHSFLNTYPLKIKYQ